MTRVREEEEPGEPEDQLESLDQLCGCMGEQENMAGPSASAPGAPGAAVPLAVLAARLAAVWARCGGEGDAAAAARSSPLALLAGLEVRAVQPQSIWLRGARRDLIFAHQV